MELKIAHAAAIAQSLGLTPRPKAVCFSAGQVIADGQVLAVREDLPVEVLMRQLDLCMHYLEIRKRAAQVLLMWRTAFEEKETLTFNELLEAARQGSPPTQPVLDSVALWQERWKAYQLSVFQDSATRWIPQVEGFGPNVSSEERKTQLNTTPLFAEWPHKLTHDRFWSTIASPWERFPDLPLDEMWVDLHLCKPTRWTEADTSSSGASFPDSSPALDELTTISPYRVFEGLVEPTAILGRPGSGKTTLLKWAARNCVVDAGSRFLLPLFVPLRKYTLDRRATPGLTLLRFFLKQRGILDPDQIVLWEQYFGVLSKGGQGGTAQARVIWLLDGWDETPTEDEGILLTELEKAAALFPVVIASRLVGRSLSFPVGHRFEIGRLTSASIRRLVEQWFGAMKKPRQTQYFLERIEAHADLKRLAGNPFLLTLLCCIAFDPLSDSSVNLPTKRVDIYEQALKVISSDFRTDTENENGEYKQRDVLLTDERWKCTDRFALSLMNDVEGAPIYLFEPKHVTQGSGDSGLFEKALRPSRLVSRVYDDYDAYQFHHTTFQEFLAARELVRRSLVKIGGDKVQDLFLRPPWLETLRFAAAFAGERGNEPFRNLYWKCLRERLHRPDLFGQVERRLAYLLAEERPMDGGESLLGEDLRDRLWDAVLKAAQTYQPAMNFLVDAFLELDPANYRTRVAGYLAQASAATAVNLRRSLRHLPPGSNDSNLVTDLFSEDETTSSLALYAYSSASIDQIAAIRGVMRCRERSFRDRKRAVDFLLHGSDPELDRDLRKMLDDDGSEEWQVEVRGALGQIESIVAVEGLRRDLERLVETPGSHHRLAEADVKALTNNSHPVAQRWLERLLVSSDFDDSRLATLIGGYSHNPIHDAMSAWLWDVIQHSNVKENRLAALCVLRDSTWRETPRLVQTVVGPSKNEFRLEALLLLEHRAGLEAVRHLFEVADRNDCEDPAELVLSATRIAHRCRNIDNSAMLQTEAAPRVQKLMMHGNPNEMRAATEEAWRFGASPRLVQLLKESNIPEVRRAAVVSLGKLGGQAAEALDDLIDLVPDGETDWEHQALTHSDPAIVPIAVKAILNIDPTRLLGISNPACDHALRVFSYETGHWVFEDHILDQRGQRLQGRTKARRWHSSQPLLENVGGGRMSEDATREYLIKIGNLKGLLVDRSRNGTPSEEEYATLRAELVSIPAIRDALPTFVLKCRTIQEFWQFIKPKFATWSERTGFLQREFDPLMTALEQAQAPSCEQLSAPVVKATTPRPDVLLVTVNEYETRAVHDEFESATRAPATPVPLDGRVYRDLGTLNGTTVFHALSEMGSSSVGAMQQTVDKAIRALDPGAVIAVGIAFGVNEKKQSIGDILLSKQLRPYDLQKVGSELVLRGDKPHSTPRLINHFEGFAQTVWTGAKVRPGVVLTGDKLIDDIDYRDALVALERQAVGGEMEGAGLYVPCYEHKVDWIVIKAICDWADGNKSKNKTRRQKKAARNAVHFLIQALQYAPLKRHK